MAQFKKRDLHRGLISFMEKKQLSMRPFHMFADRNGYTKDQCINTFFKENWNKFATFVDKGLKSGEIRGKDVALSEGRYESLKERKKLFNKKVPTRLKNLLKELNTSLGDSKYFLDSYLNSYFTGQVRIERITDWRNKEERIKALRHRKELEYLLDNDLVQDFIDYIKVRYNK